MTLWKVQIYTRCTHERISNVFTSGHSQRSSLPTVFPGGMSLRVIGGVVRRLTCMVDVATNPLEEFDHFGEDLEEG